MASPQCMITLEMCVPISCIPHWIVTRCHFLLFFHASYQQHPLFLAKTWFIYVVFFFFFWSGRFTQTKHFLELLFNVCCVYFILTLLFFWRLSYCFINKFRLTARQSNLLIPHGFYLQHIRFKFEHLFLIFHVDNNMYVKNIFCKLIVQQNLT